MQCNAMQSNEALTNQKRGEGSSSEVLLDIERRMRATEVNWREGGSMSISCWRTAV